MKKISLLMLIILVMLFIGCKANEDIINENQEEDELYYLSDDCLTFKANLQYNEGTNYRWYYELNNQGVIVLENEEYIPNESSNDILGKEGKYKASFVADPELNNDRRVIITYTYNTPQGNDKHPKTYEFHLYVMFDGSIMFDHMVSKNLNGPDEDEHVWNHIQAKKVTCVEDGYNEYDECIICGEKRGYEFLEKFGGDHDFVFVSDNHSISKESPIYEEYKCSKCGETTGTYDNALNRSKLDMENLNILLIGNSYTNYNTMMNCLKGVITGEGISVNIVKVSYGSQYLYDYIEGPQGDYYDKVVEAVKKNHFDIVFLQDQSSNPAEHPANFYDSVRDLYKYFTDLGTTCILYETWTRKKGMNSWTPYEMAQRLCASYAAIGEELGIRVSHCGTAQYDILINHPEIETHNSDGSHPSTYISYVVALCHYATIYGRSPIGINYKYNDYIKDESITWHADNERVEIDDATQRILEEAAYNACFGPSMLEDKFKTTSLGVTEK